MSVIPVVIEQHAEEAAFLWLPFNQTDAYVQDLATAESPALRRIGLAACVAHRQNPGQPLLDALSDDDAVLRDCALRTAGELDPKDLLPLIKDHIEENDENCRFYATWSAAILGDPSAVPDLCNIAESDGPHTDKAQHGLKPYASFRRTCMVARTCQAPKP